MIPINAKIVPENKKKCPADTQKGAYRTANCHLCERMTTPPPAVVLTTTAVDLCIVHNLHMIKLYTVVSRRR